MKLKRYTSHLTISSDNNNKENEKNKNNLSNIEKYIQRLILISIRTKKILEKNDYFYQEEKRRKFDLKNIKIKPTPFQKYQIFKHKKFPIIEKQINHKRILTSYPINSLQRMNKINPNLITMNHFNVNRLRKNKTTSNNQIQFYRTHNNFFFKPKRLLFSPLQTETNNYNNNRNLKSKSNYHTINNNKSNKVIQTSERKKRSKEKTFSSLERFPILNIFNCHPKIKINLLKFKLGKEKAEKNNRPDFDKITRIKFNDLILG